MVLSSSRRCRVGRREFVGLRQAAERGHGGQERFEQFAVLLEAQLGEALARCRRSTAKALGEEAVARGLVLEDVADAERGGDGLGVEWFIEVRLEFVVAEEFREGAAPVEDARFLHFR
jgi:hypothetical protein